MEAATLPRARAVFSAAVEIKLGGRTRHLQMDLNAMALIDEKMGINLLMGGLPPTISPAQLKIYLWAAMLSGDRGTCEPELMDPEAGPDLIGSWVLYNGATTAMIAATESLRRAQVQPEDLDEADLAAEAEAESADDDEGEPKNVPGDSRG